MTVHKRQRLDKMLAHIGFGTRKEIKKLIKEGRVTVNHEVAGDPGMHVTPGADRVEVNGELVIYREHIYLLMNKPEGVISATEDRYQETVIDLLEPEHRVFDPFPVGRLDKDTEGLLILTSDGKLAHQLLSPKKHVPKVYEATVAGRVTEEDAEHFRQGVKLDDGYVTMPAELEILESGPVSRIRLTVYEGKFHQVKRMFEAVGKKVTFLKRVAMGPLVLDPDLEPGEYRELSEEEVNALKNASSG
ncbi:pseudouridine synthase [Staphylospora marina]|uniref:pseudouridine synthase n=1 Tax=Staphylospora marina TaxID=2490858 RepID=UPI000F5BE2A7|nr:pseudouridine synthase [Staphylospora marina]